MKLIKPKFWESKNFISFILYPLSAITFLINFTKKFSIKKTLKLNQYVLVIYLLVEQEKHPCNRNK